MHQRVVEQSLVYVDTRARGGGGGERERENSPQSGGARRGRWAPATIGPTGGGEHVSIADVRGTSGRPYVRRSHLHMYVARQVRAKAFAMPLTSPAFPPGPYRFVNREYLIITYRTCPAAIARILPAPLVAPEPLVKYEVRRPPPPRSLAPDAGGCCPRRCSFSSLGGCRCSRERTPC